MQGEGSRLPRGRGSETAAHEGQDAIDDDFSEEEGVWGWQFRRERNEWSELQEHSCAAPLTSCGVGFARVTAHVDAAPHSIVPG